MDAFDRERDREYVKLLRDAETALPEHAAAIAAHRADVIAEWQAVDRGERRTSWPVTLGRETSRAFREWAAGRGWPWSHTERKRRLAVVAASFAHE